MAATITLDNLVDGQEIVLPYEVRGRAAGVAPPATNLVDLNRQIDNNPLRNMGDECTPVLPPAAASVDFAFELTTLDCPQVGAWYLLTLYAWDDRGDLTPSSVTFRILEEIIPEDPHAAH
jgi:hypothetical protein